MQLEFIIITFILLLYLFFFFSSRRRHTRYIGDWSSDVCSSDLFEVVAEKTMDVPFKKLQDVLPEQIYAFVRTLELKNADGVYIPCNQWAGCDAAPLIELDTGLPVVTGGHADFWEAFRSIGVPDRIQGHG